MDNKELVDEMVKIVEAAFEKLELPLRHGQSQVINADDLIVGRIYIWHRLKFGSEEATDKWLCLTKPYTDDEDRMIVAMAKWPAMTIGQDFNLADLAIQPYGDGQWSRLSWLEKTTQYVEQATVDYAIRELTWRGDGRNPFVWE